MVSIFGKDPFCRVVRLKSGHCISFLSALILGMSVVQLSTLLHPSLVAPTGELCPWRVTCNSALPCVRC